MSGLGPKVAHDLRGVLNSLNMVLQLHGPGKIASLHEKALAEVDKGRELADTVGSLLACEEPCLERWNLSSLWRSVASQYPDLVEGVSVNLHSNQDSFVDSELIMTMYKALLTNARRAVAEAHESMEEGSIKVEIQDTDSETLFSCSDSGKGFSLLMKDSGPESGASHWLEPSYGYGLFLVTRIVKAHGGSIEFTDSSELGGAKVLVRLPAYQESSEDSEPS